MNRREMMKLFGLGALIVPASAGVPLARIIEAPKVEIVDPAAAVIKTLDLAQVKTATVTLAMDDGSVHVFQSTYIMGAGRVPSHGAQVEVSFSVENAKSPAAYVRAGELCFRV